VTFGSIDDVSAPISSSPAATPPTKSEGVKTFGSVPVATGHVNGKQSISSRASVVPPTASTSTAASSVLSAATPPVKPKIDIKKMFQSPSSAPSSNPLSDTPSPSIRNVALPTQQQQPLQGQLSHTPPSHRNLLIILRLLSLVIT
jgi:translation initiation factor 4G